MPKMRMQGTYQYDEFAKDLLFTQPHEPSFSTLERCAACGHIFDIDDHLDEDDEPQSPGGAG